ncbi:MAG TPA: AAA family ATPase [Candidatus Baltobacteraceae bacterium]|nr:AAA family ATPase [Candidatus Baltobacteraceae bacterium]
MIFVSGQHGSGKTTLSKSHVLESNGFVSVDSGPLLREQHFVGVGEERLVSTARLKQLDCENPNMVGQTVVRGISRMARAGVLDEAQEIIVVGIRSMRSVRYITNNIKFGRRDMLVYLEAPPEMLLQRYNARERSRLHMASSWPCSGRTSKTSLRR